VISNAELPKPHNAESIERFIEDQAFSRSYDTDPRDPRTPLPHTSAVTATLGKTEEERQLADGEGRGNVGNEPNHT
jgi:hypothetical protein